MSETIQQQAKTMSTGKYYMTKVADGIKGFTQTMCMKSIVNGFIAVMPVIIVASIFTLLVALPEMVMSVALSDVMIANPDWGIVPGAAQSISMMEYYKRFTEFGTFQYWGQNISNWSMGVLGVFVTASISKNMGAALNEKLPMERRINELTLIFAAISTYLMLSVIEFTVSGDSITGQAWQNYEYYGAPTRGIFVDGLAAQGILPGILIALTMPWFFYWTYKYNWTIRLPKQVPQTISQAFLGVIPLFIVLFVYGTLAFVTNIALGMPVLFYLFKLIQEGLTANASINDSYGLIAIYTTMEGGFWFLGVHPEPVHAIMRATFWFENINSNALLNESHIFTEPYMYGYGAMGGSGCTLMVPFICLLFARSDQMKIVGNTGSLPIIFQVNEPTLFGVPCILNPLFFIPMIFTGMANDMIFKAIADSTNFQAGSLYLPWSTPYFLQTSLGTPAAWQVWAMDIIALAIATGLYLPSVIIQDNIYCKAELAKKGLADGNFKTSNGLDVIKQSWFNIDFETNSEFKKWKLNKKDILKQMKLNHAPIKEIEDFKKQMSNESISIRHDINNRKVINMINFINNIFWNKERKIINNADSKIDTIVMKIKDKTQKNANKIEKHETKIEKNNLTIAVFENAKNSHQQKKLNKFENKIKQAKIDNEFKLRNGQNINVNNTLPTFDKNQLSNSLFSKWCDYKIKKAQEKIQKIKNLKSEPKKIKIHQSIKKEHDYLICKKTFKALCKKELAANKILKNYLRINEKIKDQALEAKINISWSDKNAYNKYLDKKELKIALKMIQSTLKNEWIDIAKKNIKDLSNGINPYKNNFVVQEIKQINSNTKQKQDYKVLVLCLGAGSSAVLANTINKGMREKGINNIQSSALAWGSHDSALNTADLVILSPQMGANAKSMQSIANEKGFKLIATRGKEYIDLSRDPIKAAELVLIGLNLMEKKE